MSIKTKFNPMGGLGIKYFTLTISTNPSSATCNLTYEGITYTTKSLKVKAGSTVSYSVYHTTYGTKNGSVIVDSDKLLTFIGQSSSSTTTTYSMSPNLKKVGGISVSTEGLATGFASGGSYTSSNTKYICTTSNSSAIMNGTNWEIFVKFMFSGSGSGIRTICGVAYNNGYAGCNIFRNASNKLHVVINKSNTASILNQTGSITMSDGTWYTVKVAASNGVYSISSSLLNYSTTNSSSTNWTTKPIHYGIYYSTVNGYTATDMTLDLKESYIKSNGSDVVNNKNSSTTYTYFWEVS